MCLLLAAIYNILTHISSKKGLKFDNGLPIKKNRKLEKLSNISKYVFKLDKKEIISKFSPIHKSKNENASDDRVINLLLYINCNQSLLEKL